MNIFNSIVSKIFSHKDVVAANASQGQGPLRDAAQPNQENLQSNQSNPSMQSGMNQNATSPAPSSVDAISILTALAQKNPQKLNWQHSIVDLLKLLDMDSSMAARTQLAKELNYTGDLNDSATMNTWLQQQVMQKFGENGGKMPTDLLH
jgi:hypothetical protein